MKPSTFGTDVLIGLAPTEKKYVEYGALAVLGLVALSFVDDIIFIALLKRGLK